MLADLNSWRSLVSSTLARKADFHSDACMLVKLRFNFEGKTVIHHFGTSARKLVLKRLTFELSVVRFVHVFGSVVSGFQ